MGYYIEFHHKSVLAPYKFKILGLWGIVFRFRSQIILGLTKLLVNETMFRFPSQFDI